MARAQHGKRAARRYDALDEYLHPAARCLRPHQSRLDHARVIEDEQIPLTNEFRQVGKTVVRALPGIALEMEHPAGTALGSRKLRDERGRQIVFELFNSHGAHYIGGCGRSRLPVKTELSIIALPCRNGGTDRRMGLTTTRLGVVAAKPNLAGHRPDKLRAKPGRS